MTVGECDTPATEGPGQYVGVVWEIAPDKSEGERMGSLREQDTVVATEEIGELGQRIRYLRKLKRMRLRDLAGAVGCSESLLSKVELNRATPSLRMLHRIMAELDSNIGALFSEAGTDEVLIYHEGERPLVRIADSVQAGGIRLQRLAPVGEGRILEANIHEVDPGANNGGEIKHEGEEVGYVLSGELELTVANRTFRLSEGASFHFRSDLPHSYRNPCDTVTRVLWVNSPPTF